MKGSNNKNNEQLTNSDYIRTQKTLGDVWNVLEKEIKDKINEIYEIEKSHIDINNKIYEDLTLTQNTQAQLPSKKQEEMIEALKEALTIADETTRLIKTQIALTSTTDNHEIAKTDPKLKPGTTHFKQQGQQRPKQKYVAGTVMDQIQQLKKPIDAIKTNDKIDPIYQKTIGNVGGINDTLAIKNTENSLDGMRNILKKYTEMEQELRKITTKQKEAILSADPARITKMARKTESRISNFKGNTDLSKSLVDRDTVSEVSGKYNKTVHPPQYKDEIGTEINIIINSALRGTLKAEVAGEKIVKMVKNHGDGKIGPVLDEMIPAFFSRLNTDRQILRDLHTAVEAEAVKNTKEKSWSDFEKHHVETLKSSLPAYLESMKNSLPKDVKVDKDKLATMLKEEMTSHHDKMGRTFIKGDKLYKVSNKDLGKSHTSFKQQFKGIFKNDSGKDYTVERDIVTKYMQDMGININLEKNALIMNEVSDKKLESAAEQFRNEQKKSLSFSAIEQSSIELQNLQPPVNSPPSPENKQSNSGISIGDIIGEINKKNSKEIISSSPRNSIENEFMKAAGERGRRKAVDLSKVVKSNGPKRDTSPEIKI